MDANGPETEIEGRTLEHGTSGGPQPPDRGATKFRCLTERDNSAHIHSACIGAEQKRFSRWKPGSVVTFTVITASFPSRGWAKFAQRALVEAANDWNSKDIGVTFRPADPGDRAVFALKYYRAPSSFIADGFAPDSKKRILYVFEAPLRREHRQHLSNLFRHELGHILGLRHENAATQETGVPSVELTPANTLSIMNPFTTFSHMAQHSIQESDVAAVRKLCALDQDTFDGFDVITVDPDTLDRPSFDSSGRLSSIDSELLSMCDLDCINHEGPPGETGEAEELAAIQLEGTIQANSEEPGLSNSPCAACATSGCAAPESPEDFRRAIFGGVEVFEGSSGEDANDAHGTSPSEALQELPEDSAQISEEESPSSPKSPPRSPSYDRPESFLDVPKDTKFKNETGHTSASWDALTPDPGSEDMFFVKDNPFAFSPGQLSKLLNPKSPFAFYALGGLAGLEIGLRTSREAGLSVDEAHLDGTVLFDQATAYGSSISGALGEKPKFCAGRTEAISPMPFDSGNFGDRKRVFGVNEVPEARLGLESFLKLAWTVYRGRRSLMLLTIFGLVSFSWSLGSDLLLTHDGAKPNGGWAEGVAIVLCIVVFVTGGAFGQFYAQRQLAWLNRKRGGPPAQVIRSGQRFETSVTDIMVGDVVVISAGDIIPVDGVLIEGLGVKCDESMATGESDLLPKSPADQLFALLHGDSSTNDIQRMDPFLISGAVVTAGQGIFLATAVGVNSSYGRIMMAMSSDVDEGGCQTRKMTSISFGSSKLGMAFGLLLFIIYVIKFLIKLPHSPLTPEGKGQAFLGLLVVCIAVCALISLSDISLLLTAWTWTRMFQSDNLVRSRRAWEKAASITTVCTGATGLLTQQKMKVVAATLGRSAGFDLRPPGEDRVLCTARNIYREFPNAPAQAVQAISSDAKDLLVQSIVVNSTALEGYVEGEIGFVGSQMEVALLNFARDFLAARPTAEERHNACPVGQVPFSASKKFMSTTVRLPNGKFRVYVKGAAEIVVERCAKVIDDASHDDLPTVNLTNNKSEGLREIIDSYGQSGLRQIGFAYRDFWDVPDHPHSEMTLLAIFGISAYLRHCTKEAVRECEQAGVVVRLVTGNSLQTARRIARDAGIDKPDSIILEGSAFRRMNDVEQRLVAPRLRVLARASGFDEAMLVRTLRGLGEVVAVTGGEVDDMHVLKTADVSFAKGISGTSSANSAAAITLMDDNFFSVVRCIRRGRAFNDAFRKCLQFQLTAIITATLLTFTSVISSDVNESPVLSVAQLLWVVLITKIATLALASSGPTDRIMDRRPERLSSPIITLCMTKMILGQIIYHLTITLVLYFGWFHLFDRPEAPDVTQAKIQRNAFVFNTFVWLQIFNTLNSRRLDNRFNVFERILCNKLFFLTNALTAGGQVLVILVGGKAFRVIPLDGKDWGISVGIAAMSLPYAVMIRLIPDAWAIGPYELACLMVRRCSPKKESTDDDDIMPSARGKLHENDDASLSEG